ncbi:MAG: S8 family serine peptidase, partial [Anaerolineae bacterium]|nr:S8 family serine peptidase [Anaerolineae bacterium]
MRIQWRMLGGVIVCVLLMTGLLSPLRADRTAFSATVMPEAEPVAGPPLRLAAGTVDPLRDDAPGNAIAALQLSAYPGNGMGYYLVQFQGPIAESDVDALEAVGAEVFDYIPDYAYIVRMDNAQRAAVEQMAQIRWVGLYQPAYRLAPDLLVRAVAIEHEGASADAAPLTLVVSVFRGEAVATVAASIQNLRGVILDQSQTNWQSKFKVTLPANALVELASIPGVRWVERAPQWQLYNDRSDNIMGVRSVWDTQGLYGAGQTVAVCDSGLDQGSTAPASLHNDFENGSGVSRVVALYDLVGGGDGASDVNSGHGTHVAGSVLGNGDLSGATPSTHTYPESAYVGMAPEASLIFQASEDNGTGELSGIPFDLNDLFAQAATAGADLHTNSWGSDEASAYTTDSENVDEYMWDHKNFTVLFAAANAGIDADSDGVVDLYSMGSPATAKNCVTVGASENNRPTLTYTWGGIWPDDFPEDPVYSDYVADDITGLAAFSSRGPVLDYRYKPDVVAPGTFIASVRSSLASESGWGVINADYMYMGGTSMATPLTAGAATIVRQFYTDVKGHSTPSAALIKATLINGATDIYPGQYGTGATQEIPATRPTNVAGWGRVDIQNSIFPTAPRAMNYVDETAGLSTAASDVYNYQITSSTEPFRVTLAWTDYPGSPAANGALVNDLDLTITGPSGTTYYPNNALLSNGSSSATYDRVNNVEGIDIASPATGLYTVTVRGHNVPHGPQPYALIASGVFTTANTPPMIDGLPDQMLEPGESKNDAIDLWAYASDDADVDAALTFTITNSPPPTLGVTIDGNRHIDINPTGSFTGTFPVVVEVMDTGGLTDTDSFDITFAEIVNTPPTLSGLPDQTLEPAASKNNAIDLWAYASDDLDASSALTFTITNSPPLTVGVTIDINRYIDINPTGSFTGTFPVVVEVMDTGGLTDTDSFDITFAEL